MYNFSHFYLLMFRHVWFFIWYVDMCAFPDFWYAEIIRITFDVSIYNFLYFWCIRFFIFFSNFLFSNSNVLSIDLHFDIHNLNFIYLFHKTVARTFLLWYNISIKIVWVIFLKWMQNRRTYGNTQTQFWKSSTQRTFTQC